MKKIFLVILSIVTIITAPIILSITSQAQNPITKIFEWTLPNQYTDGSQLENIIACRIYVSTISPFDFSAGINSPNFLVSIPTSTTTPKGKIINSTKITWHGYFNNSNVWVRITAIDIDNNESDFSNYTTFSINNVSSNNPINLIIKLTVTNNINCIEIIASRLLENNEKFVFSSNLNTRWIDVPTTLITNNSILIPISNSLDQQFFAITNTITPIITTTIKKIGPNNYIIE